MSKKYLVINSGSSSLKFSLYESEEQKEIVNGYFEKIGLEDSFYTLKFDGNKEKKNEEIKDHEKAIDIMIKELLDNKFIKSIDEIGGIGHRVLHGGDIYANSVLIDDKVVSNIKNLIPLGPLHQPANLKGIESMMKLLPNTKQVASFDTAFHQTIPEENFLYPVPYSWYENYKVRKYGFHGISHKYITKEFKEKLNKEDVNLIICHIGSGASISCIKNGKCFDTTMGISPLDGLMMGTRCGAIDPSILEYVYNQSGMNIKKITNDLNKKSGLLGIAGHADCRDVETLAEKGDKKALLALKMDYDRIAKYIAEYYLKLEGKVDAIIFTAGIGENGIEFRENIINILSPLNIILDKDKNNEIASFKKTKEGKISKEESSIPVYVMPTNEEKMILEDTIEIINNL